MTHPFDTLTPDAVVGCVEAIGLQTDLRLLALNSYENRVYQVGLEDTDPVIVKFYRPDRWSYEQILEEHAFALELEANDLSVVAPLSIGGHTLHEAQGFLIAAFPRRGGHAPERLPTFVAVEAERVAHRTLHPVVFGPLRSRRCR